MKRLLPRVAFALLVGGGLLASSLPVRADTPEQLTNQAFAKYESGDYPAAVALYMKAYEISVDSRILFNVAQIYDKKVQDRDLAIEFYRRYLKSTTTEPDLVAKATARVTELGRQQSAPDPTASATPPSSSQPPPTSSALPDPAPPPATPPAASDSPPFFVGWIVAGVLGAGAVVTGSLSLSTSGELRDETFQGPAPDDVESLHTRAAVLAGLTDGLIAGAVVAGGVTLILQLTHKPASAEKAAAFLVVPMAASDRVGAVVVGEF